MRLPQLMPLLIAALAACGDAAAFEAADLHVPAMVRGADRTSGKGCQPVRALRPAELPRPWRDAVRTITLRCEPMRGLDGEPDAQLVVRAELRPGAVTLAGVPVAALHLDNSWAHSDSQYLLDAPYAEVRPVLQVLMRSRCLRLWPVWPVPPGVCEAVPDSEHGGLYMRTSELGGTWLHADAKDPKRTVYADASSE